MLARRASVAIHTVWYNPCGTYMGCPDERNFGIPNDPIPSSNSERGSSVENSFRCANPSSFDQTQ